MIVTSIGERWKTINEEINLLCNEFQLNKPVVIAVSKTRSQGEIEEAIKAGIMDFGENNPQEFKRKSEKYPEVHWHFIGHLQRNNARDVVQTAYHVHTIDRKKLVNRLEFLQYNKTGFIQVNISGEVSKSGVAYEREPVEELISYSESHGIQIAGLMTIGNPSWDEETTISKYKEFVDFGKSLQLFRFSLGMSSDWRSALIAGATHLRIGTAIFGPRTVQ